VYAPLAFLSRDHRHPVVVHESSNLASCPSEGLPETFKLTQEDILVARIQVTRLVSMSTTLRPWLFGYYKQLKSDFVDRPFLLTHWLSPNVIKIDFTNTIALLAELLFIGLCDRACRSVCLLVCLSAKCIVAKWLIGSGCRLGW